MCAIQSEPAGNLRRSPRLIKKERSNDLVRSVLNIPIYVPKQLGVASDIYTSADRIRDFTNIQTYLDRAEELKHITGRDGRIACTINIACIYIYLCDNPSVLKHNDVFRETVRNKRDEFIEIMNKNSVRYADDTELNRTYNILRRIFSRIAPML